MADEQNRIEAEANLRRSKMLSRHVTYEKDCLLCKVVSGFGFVGFAGFNVWRASGVWSYLSVKDKLFNVTAITFIFSVAALNWYYGYRIYMG